MVLRRRRLFDSRQVHNHVLNIHGNTRTVLGDYLGKMKYTYCEYIDCLVILRPVQRSGLGDCQSI